MASEAIVDFDNHVLKCRCCMREFEIDDTQIKITLIVQMRFEELTSLTVRF